MITIKMKRILFLLLMIAYGNINSMDPANAALEASVAGKLMHQKSDQPTEKQQPPRTISILSNNSLTLPNNTGAQMLGMASAGLGLAMTARSFNDIAEKSEFTGFAIGAAWTVINLLYLYLCGKK
jgi:hypothetical protein